MIWISLKKIGLVPQKPKNSIKTTKLKLKKISQGTALRKICTKFGSDWNIFRRRNEDTYSVATQKSGIVLRKQKIQTTQKIDILG